MTFTYLHNAVLESLPVEGSTYCYFALDYAIIGRDDKQKFYIIDNENNTTRQLSRIAAIALLNKLEKKFNV